MRLLVWSPFYLPEKGGVETLLSRLLPRLVERGHAVTVVAAHGRHEVPDDCVQDGVRVRRFRFREAIDTSDFRATLAITREVAALRREVSPELTHVFCLFPSTFFHLRTAQVVPGPTVLTLQSDYLADGHSLADGTLFRHLLDAAGQVTAVSRAVHDSVLGADPGLAAKLQVIHNAVDVPPRRALGPSPGGTEILLVGRLVPQKGVDLALEVFRRLAPDHPDARLTIAGTGPLREDLEAQAAAAGIAPRVRFLGEVPHDRIAELLREATLLFMPSRVEGLSLALLEATAVGCPVVATAVAGTGEVLVDGVSGRLVPPDDLDALTAALRAAIADPAATEVMADAARAQVLERFHLDKIRADYERLYAELVPA